MRYCVQYISYLKTLQTEYEQARDKWIEVHQLRTDWKSEDPVYNEVLRDYKEKMAAYHRHFVGKRAESETGSQI